MTRILLALLALLTGLSAIGQPIAARACAPSAVAAVEPAEAVETARPVLAGRPSAAPVRPRITRAAAPPAPLAQPAPATRIGDRARE